jgi:uncharacterized repeat protein (TIGR01451 family)
MSPRKVIAPVGGEVLFLAGVCGNDGYLMTGEPLEWMLSSDSVGNIIQVGDDDRWMLHQLASSRSPRAGKVDGQFARGRTSTKPSLITRGTRTTNDDVPLRKGEAWLSLSSPSEGISRVTVLAPESECWDRRHVTATIYWIDANYQFPQPQVVPSGRPARLVTKVTRSDATIPAEGWIVRYQVLNPNLAGFAPDGRDTIEVPVNGQAEAVVDLLQKPGAAGTFPVEVQIIRPAQSDLPRMSIARGQTAVSWSAPQLRLEILAPRTAGYDQPVTIVTKLQNPGDMPVENLTMELEMPGGVVVEQAEYSPTQVPGKIRWTLQNLPPRQALDISCVLRSKAPFRSRVLAQGSNVPAVQQEFAIDVFQPSLNLEVRPGADRVEAGKEVPFNILIRNVGDRPLTNLRVDAEGNSDMVHLQTGRAMINRTRDEGPLAPGQSWNIAVTFVPARAGQQCIIVRAQADGSQSASQQACVIATNPPVSIPALDGQVTAIPEIRLGERSRIRMSVVNSGQVPLTRVRIAGTGDARLRAMNGDAADLDTQRSLADRNEVVWVIPRLEVGQSATREVEIEGTNSPGEGQWIMALSSEQGASVTRSVRVRVLPAQPATSILPPEQPPRTPVLPDRQDPGLGSSVLPNSGFGPGTDNLKINLIDTTDPVVVGEPIRYTLSILNEGNNPVDGVQVRVRYPEMLKFGSMEGVQPSFPMAGVMDLPTINTLRGGELITRRFAFESPVAQVVALTVEVTARRSNATIRDQTETTVRPR